MMKRLSFYAALLFLAGACSPPPAWQSSTLVYFDTLCQIRLSCSRQTFTAAEARIRQAFQGVESLFSPGAQRLESPEVVSLFRQAMAVHRHSDGCFDVTLGSISRLWGFHGGKYRVPSAEEIKTALSLVGMEKVKIEKDRLVLPEGMILDWGGIAKGLGIDLAAKEALAMGISQGFINAGGDLYCWGKNPRNSTWKVGIQHPREAGFLGVLSLSFISAATTGDYQRFFTRNGKRYHHVLDPRTGYPARGKMSVTVIGPETVLSDAISTALFVSQHPEKILKFYPDYGAVIVDEGGNTRFLGRKYSFRPSANPL